MLRTSSKGQLTHTAYCIVSLSRLRSCFLMYRWIINANGNEHLLRHSTRDERARLQIDALMLIRSSLTFIWIDSIALPMTDTDPMRGVNVLWSKALEIGNLINLTVCFSFQFLSQYVFFCPLLLVRKNKRLFWPFTDEPVHRWSDAQVN